MINDCIFCKISEGRIPSKKIFDGKNFFVINDISPVSEGHCLIISKNHFETILDLPDSFGGELINIIKQQSNRLINNKLADGIKLVQNNFDASGQVVKHFHLHIIPEKNGVKIKKSI
jgi:histidine triad (HIT) family protein